MLAVLADEEGAVGRAAARGLKGTERLAAEVDGGSDYVHIGLAHVLEEQHLPRRMHRAEGGAVEEGRAAGGKQAPASRVTPGSSRRDATRSRPRGR